MTSTAAGRTALKRNEVLSFDDGLLTVRIDGHGAQDGWATLAFHERQVEVDADGFHTVEIPPSELRAIRDFLNRLTAAPDLVKALDRLYRAYVNMLEGGRDRIVFLGGDCDPVEVMEAGDPVLVATRAVLAAVKGDGR